jgi:hypothetical protein
MAVNEFRTEKIVGRTLSVYEELLGEKFPAFFSRAV